MKQKMACHQVTPLWAHRVPASPFTHPSPRARDESPSSTALTRTTTCHQRRYRVTPPSPAKGETQKHLKEWVRGKEHMCVYLNVDIFIKKYSYHLSLLPLFSLLSNSSNCPFASQTHGRRLYCHPFCSSEFYFIDFSLIYMNGHIRDLLLLPVPVYTVQLFCTILRFWSRVL